MSCLIRVRMRLSGDADASSRLFPLLARLQAVRVSPTRTLLPLCMCVCVCPLHTQLERVYEGEDSSSEESEGAKRPRV